MLRDKREVALHDGRVRHIVVVTCPIEGDARMTQGVFLNFLAANQRVLECGPSLFETLSLHYNGRAWQAEATATVKGES